MTWGDVAIIVFYVVMALVIGSKCRKWLQGRRAAMISRPERSPDGLPSPKQPPLPSAISFSPEYYSLGKLLRRIEAGSYDFPDSVRSGIGQRIREVIDLLGRAQDALRKGAPDALAIAAGSLATIRYITGIAWHKYLAEVDRSFKVTQRIDRALLSDERSIVNEIARLLAERSGPTVRTVADSYTLHCAACGIDAVTYEWKDGEISYPTLSPVNTYGHVGDDSAERLRKLLEQGNVREAAELIDSKAGPGCAYYCPDCDRVYCKDHLAVETEWSGSWHTATYATCPLGHRKEFE